MKIVRFLERGVVKREGEADRIYEVDSFHYLRDDQVKHWIARNAAVEVEPPAGTEVLDLQNIKPPELKESDHGKTVDRPADVGKPDSSDPGVRPVDEQRRGRGRQRVADSSDK